MTISALLVFAPTLLVAAGSPGPSIAALVARVLAHGLRGLGSNPMHERGLATDVA